MALTKISTGGFKDDAASQAKIADEAIDEARLQISNAGTNGQFLQKQSGNTGGLTWATVDSTPEGTAIKSTGESGTSKFLRVDGDGSCSWQVPPDNDTVYTHPNHSGEVTSSADGAQTIASNVVDEDNLKISNAGTNGQFLQKQSGNTGGLTWADVDTGGEVVRQAQYTSSGSYTVPSGVTTIRAYAVGAGGNGGICGNSQYQQTSGAGGGMAYGDFTVVPGQTVTITISNRTATVAYGGTTLLTGNPGAHATDNGGNQATAGTATKHSSVTNGGAYSGGAGGSINTGGGGPGGASAGSPLGNGSRANHSGGAGIGTVGVWTSVSGGGAGSGSSGSGTHYVSGGSGPNCRGRDGARYALYTDPLIKHCVMPGAPGHVGYNISSVYNYYSEHPTGVGGHIVQSISPYSFWTFGNGGSFAGGAGGGINTGSTQDIAAGDGGILGGGGAAGYNTGSYYPGDGGYGGGGGAGKYESGGSSQRGQGGAAVVWIFHA